MHFIFLSSCQSIFHILHRFLFPVLFLALFLYIYIYIYISVRFALPFLFISASNKHRFSLCVAIFQLYLIPLCFGFLHSFLWFHFLFLSFAPLLCRFFLSSLVSHMTATKTTAPHSSSLAAPVAGVPSCGPSVDKSSGDINDNDGNRNNNTKGNDSNNHAEQNPQNQKHNHDRKDLSKHNASGKHENVDNDNKENNHDDNPLVATAINTNTNTITTTTTNSTLATLSPPSLSVPSLPPSNPFRSIKVHHSQTQPQRPLHAQSQSQSQSHSHVHPPAHSHAHPQTNVNSPPSVKPATSPRHAPSHSDPVLPRNSRVRIVGNNRTKWDLIGRVGVVRAAQTLGGWHEVELTDGGIVRVQRNALTVLQLPPDDPPSSAVRIQANHSKQPTHQQNFHSTQQPHHSLPFSSSSSSRHLSSKIPLNTANPGVLPNSPASRRHQHSRHYNHHYQQYHQRQFRAKPLSGVGKVRDGASPVAVKALHANISKLHVNSLHRYRSAYNLNIAKDCSKDELVGAVSRHFQRNTVNETEVISNFLRYLARHGGPAARD